MGGELTWLFVERRGTNLVVGCWWRGRGTYLFVGWWWKGRGTNLVVGG